MDFDIRSISRILYNEYSEEITLYKLKTILKLWEKQIKEKYISIKEKEYKTEAEKWLFDNYYIIKREIFALKQELKGIDKNDSQANIGLFYYILKGAFADKLINISEKTIFKCLKEINNLQPMRVDDFDCIPLALRLGLISAVHRGACEEKQEGEKYISHAVKGFASLGDIDFLQLEESISVIEEILLKDPSGDYPLMTEKSKKYYRNTIGKLSKTLSISEENIASKAVFDAQKAKQAREKHIGFYILEGTQLTEKRQKLGENILIANIVIPIILALLLGAISGSYVVILLSLVPCYEIIRFLTEQVAYTFTKENFLPRMNLDMLAKKPKTVIAVSTLLFPPERVQELEKKLEQLWFKSVDENIYVAVLGDFKESKYTNIPEQATILEANKRVIEKLCSKYGDRFMLYVRNQTYSKSEDIYTNYERKRGAIEEFLRFTRGKATEYREFVGNIKILHEVEYIIALDIDTKLLFNSAQELISVAVHPLHRAVVDSKSEVVKHGYGILVPKMITDLDNYKSTGFSTLMEGCGGISGYEGGSKDFYQDTFGESVFCGKGIIDIEAFLRVLDNRLPPNQILSHDIIEGAYLKTGFVSDIEITDSTPENMTSWLSRLHRWTRGDWQNIFFLFKAFPLEGKVYINPITRLSKYKVWDNLRRSISPVFYLLSIIFAGFLSYKEAGIVILSVTLAMLLGNIYAVIRLLITEGADSFSRRFFSKTMPCAFEILSVSFMNIIMLVIRAGSSLDAISRAIYRSFSSRKNLLEWVTASEATGKGIKLNGYIMPEIIGLIVLIFGRYWFIKLFGLLFSLLIPVAILSAYPRKHRKIKVSTSERQELIDYNMAMWRYFEDFANRKNNFLPPDNMQEAPVLAIANRTSPTNIGLMLLSTLSARDFGFIDTSGLYERLNRSITTIEKLQKWNGNLYNWYNTETLEVLAPEFVSTVDSGNFICTLVALKEGLKEYTAEDFRLSALIERIKQIIDKTNLAPFFSDKRKLFSIGYNVPEGCLVTSHYDFLMSEARMTSYFAIAKRQVTQKHWGALNRAMSQNGGYSGAVSWTGTMFEYFMPHLLLPAYEGSFLYESLRYCVHCQRERVGKNKIWGISESAYAAFDSALNFQYKAHGVQSLGVKRGLNNELVISPYSSFLPLPFSKNASIENLRKLKKLGAVGNYGFFEAIDYTKARLNGSEHLIIKSYMSHHIGMSMIASNNLLFDNKMQNRFMQDNHMKAAKELLQEKIPKGVVVYKESKRSSAKPQELDSLIDEEYDNIYPQAPRTVVYKSGGMCSVLTDTGIGYLTWENQLITRKSNDFLGNPQGIFALVKVGDMLISPTKAPFYEMQCNNRTKIRTDGITYYGHEANIKASLSYKLSANTPLQVVTLRVDNTSTIPCQANMLFYLEPIIASYRDYIAHPAYSKMFLQGKYNSETKTITFARRNKDGISEPYLTMGLLENHEFEFELTKENVLTSREGLDKLKSFTEMNFTSQGSQLDSCLLLRLNKTVQNKSSEKATLLISVGRTESESVGNILKLRRENGLKPENTALSPLVRDTIEGRLAMNVLSQIIFAKRDTRANLSALSENTLGQSGLWQMGVSGDVPIVVLEADKALDLQRLAAYLRLQWLLRLHHIIFDLCILFDSSEAPNASSDILKAVNDYRVSDMLNTAGGIHSIDTRLFPKENITLIRAVSSHIAPKSMVMMSQVSMEYKPLKINPVTKPNEAIDEKCEGESKLKIFGGYFCEGSFYVEKTSPLPYCHTLSNSAMGTVVSDKALGFTWAINSRENKLTPWFNDTMLDNKGEMILLRLGDEYFDVVNGSQAIFSKHMAQYVGEIRGISTRLTVKVSDTGMIKYCDLSIKNNTDNPINLDCIYYIEPVLGVNRDTSKFIKGEHRDNGIMMTNPYQEAPRNHLMITASDIVESFTTNRAEFFMGKFDNKIDIPNNDPCAAIAVKKELPSKREERVRFILSFGATAEGAVYMAKNPPMLSSRSVNSIRISTKDKHLDEFINNFAVHQILSSRIQGRAGFYQCGGAYGFRDQLQDICAYVYIDKSVAKAHIYRCCGVQFEEGDVLHWWHRIPEQNSNSGIKGVRTRFSDDLLWLPYSIAHYVKKTGDVKLLDKEIAYLTGEALSENEHERYFSPKKSTLKETVYHHAIRAFESAYRLGTKGLLLIGTGDWNDGFSGVGREGKGESIWVTMFMIMCMEDFLPIMELKGDKELIEKYRTRIASFKKAIDEYAWDGKWYLRAFYDNGNKMGSITSDECKIDLLPQSFAVLCGMPNEGRISSGLQEAFEQLVDREHEIISLFTPPFRDTMQTPGYIKAYPSGIRENGGQYTHGAIWLSYALFKHGDIDRAYELIRMLNPIYRNSKEHLANAYKTEPYYMAADIYKNEAAIGHGGWSLYTGAAAWYYRTVLEELFGIRLMGSRLKINPKLPSEWNECSFTAMLRGTSISVRIERGSELAKKGMYENGEQIKEIKLDKNSHSIVVIV